VIQELSPLMWASGLLEYRSTRRRKRSPVRPRSHTRPTGAAHFVRLTQYHGYVDTPAPMVMFPPCDGRSAGRILESLRLNWPINSCRAYVVVAAILIDLNLGVPLIFGANNKDLVRAAMREHLSSGYVFDGALYRLGRSKPFQLKIADNDWNRKLWHGTPLAPQRSCMERVHYK
jgi:hypothetical protein